MKKTLPWYMANQDDNVAIKSGLDKWRFAIGQTAYWAMTVWANGLFTFVLLQSGRLVLNFIALVAQYAN